MTVHVPVLPDEIKAWLIPDPADPPKLILDGTMGGGGHTAMLANQLGRAGRVIGFDRDPVAVEETLSRLEMSNISGYCANYADLPEIHAHLELPLVDGILLDLGLSSDQLADHDRGFSFHADGDLDLRFDASKGEPAWRLVNRLGEKHLADLIYEFGEERLSRRVARKICEHRRLSPIRKASEFAQLLRRCIPKSKNHSIDPATRTFQALRIAVNEELKWLKVALKRLPSLLKEGGRFAVISFHSLEDRLVKTGFRDSSELKVLTKKPVTASESEISENPRSRSAKLRVATKETKAQDAI